MSRVRSAPQTAGMDLTVASLADRVDLQDAVNDLPTSWPAFMQEDPVAWMMSMLRAHPEFQLVLLDGDRLVGKAHSVPFRWDGEDASLSDSGWDNVLATGVIGAFRGRQPTALSALDRDRPGVAGQGPQPRPGRGSARRGCRRRVRRPRRAGAPVPQVRAPRRADGGVRDVATRRRPAVRPLAAGARPGRRHDREGLPGVDGDTRLARAVAVLDGPAVRPRRTGGGARRAHPPCTCRCRTTTPSTWSRTCGCGTG